MKKVFAVVAMAMMLLGGLALARGDYYPFL